MFRTTMVLALGFGLCAFSSVATADKKVSPESYRQQFLSSLHWQQGQILLPDRKAFVDIDKDFIFLPAADAQKLLTEAWSNPADDSIAGLILPSQIDPLSEESWGVAIRLHNTGRVQGTSQPLPSARHLLENLYLSASQEVTNSDVRVVPRSWIVEPTYYKEQNALYWATHNEIRYDSGVREAGVLNYKVAKLGREGYIELVFIAELKQLPVIERQMYEVLNTVHYVNGYRYADFDPKIDTVGNLKMAHLIAPPLQQASRNSLGNIFANWQNNPIIGGFLLVSVLLLTSYVFFLMTRLVVRRLRIRESDENGWVSPMAGLTGARSKQTKH